MSLSRLEIRGYDAGPDERDEMFDATGDIREAWDTLGRALFADDGLSLARHAARIRRRLVGHGTTFQIHGTGESWDLDPIPLLIDSSDWAMLRAGLDQRVRALEAIVADIFGPQRLLAAGLLPTDAIVTDRNYLRPCLGTGRQGPGTATLPHLTLYAADLARSQNGITVLSDRTEAPIGAGYALENRDLVSGAFADLAARLGTVPIARWFIGLRDALAQRAPSGVDDPRIVILTPGTSDPAYFEQSYLARTLGFTLVEPADLTVRAGRVFLKSVTGLEPVHVILRWVPSYLTDPVELRGDSTVGVPGLVEAWRRGSVSIVNALGSGIAENQALLACLGGLIAEVLGEEPILSSPQTWWCGDPVGRSHVLANLGQLIIKPVERGPDRHSWFGPNLSVGALQTLRNQIEAAPHRYIGQEQVTLSTAPCFDGEAVRPRHVVLRVFGLAQPSGYVWLEGGLTRSSERPEEVALATGGISKDTWIIDPSHRRPVAVSPLRVLPQVDLRASVSSRAAETMYWIGRNLERSEALIRSVRAAEREVDQWHELRDEADGSWMLTMSDALDALAGPPNPAPGAAETGIESEPVETSQRCDAVTAAGKSRRGFSGTGLESGFASLLVDTRRPRSLTTSLGFLLSGARSVRELFSTDTWRVLSELAERRSELERAEPGEILDTAAATLTSLSAVSGLLGESMVRDPGWRFLDVGRRIERALLLAWTLERTVVRVPVPGLAPAVYETVLAGWDSLVAYRRRHRSDIEPATLVTLLAFDRSNPRSISFQVDALAADVAALPVLTGGSESVVGLVANIMAPLESGRTHVDALVHHGDDGYREGLGALLSQLVDGLTLLGERIELGYFVQVQGASYGTG